MYLPGIFPVRPANVYTCKTNIIVCLARYITFAWLTDSLYTQRKHLCLRREVLVVAKNYKNALSCSQNKLCTDRSISTFPYR